MNAIPGLQATGSIARLSVKRVLRSRILIVGIILMALSFLPMLLGAGKSKTPEFRWEHFLRLAGVLQMLVVALFSASAIAEEIENKTYSYLWSRPIPRWSVLSGKLVVTILLGTLLSGACVSIGFSLTGATETGLLLRAILALALGGLAVSCIASCLGIIAVKYALAVSIAYFLIFDSIIGNMPFALARISVFHNVTAIAGYGTNAGTTLTSVLWLLGISSFAVTISLWRLARKEFSTGS
ncbi:MAG: ABC transporter permease [Kofleriaceae bacterium]|nr:ABC transporter permease [Kofleriaceae bacterium]